MAPRLTVALVLPFVAAASLAAGQATFRVTTEVIGIDVYVTDDDGNPVVDLTRDEFEVFERGEPRPVTAFEAIDIPIVAPRAGELSGLLPESDVQSNHRPEGRVFVFAFGQLGGWHVLRARHMARRFVQEHFGPYDVGAVAVLGGGGAGQDFTGNRRLLIEAIDRVTGGFGTASGTAGIQSGGRSEFQWRLRMLVEMTEQLPGYHKAMLLFTGTPPVDMYGLMSYRGGVLSVAGEDAHAAMSAATRGNLAIYPIDPRGLSFGTGLVDTAAYRAMAEATGGVALVNSNNLSGLFDTVMLDTSSYYMLGFEPGYDRDDGRYVPIDVRVTRPGVHVRTRPGYLAPLAASRRRISEPPEGTPPPPTPASARLAIPLATDGIPMRVFATPFRSRGGDGASVALVLELDTSVLTAPAPADARSGMVDVSFVIVGTGGRVYPQLDLAVPADQVVASGSSRLRLVGEFGLETGRYQVRIASAVGALAGSVAYDLEVPDFDDADLLLSGLALVAPSETDVFTLWPDRGIGRLKPALCDRSACYPPVADPADTGAELVLPDVVPGPPTTVREFRATDVPVLAAEVYERRDGEASRHTVTVTATLRGVDGGTTVLASTERPSQQGVPGRHAVALPISFTGVAPGEYALRLEAASNAGPGRVDAREIAIRVR